MGASTGFVAEAILGLRLLGLLCLLLRGESANSSSSHTGWAGSQFFKLCRHVSFLLVVDSYLAVASA